MHTMGKVGMGDFEKWGMILKWGGVGTTLWTMITLDQSFLYKKRVYPRASRSVTL